MNTTEIKVKHLIRSFRDLYAYAKKQFLSFEKIEGINNWEEYDFSIDCAKDQMKFKDMLQIRFIEELSEATHAMDNPDHFYEEITDALNFFLSSYIMLGVDLNELERPEDYLQNVELVSLTYNNVATTFYYLIDDVGDLCNLLKNRPWAQSNYLVSMYDFEKRLKKLWSTFWITIAQIGLNQELIFELFERKYSVNQWRIKTGY